MNKGNIHQLRLIIQDSTEGGYMDNGMSINDVIHSLIIDYGHYRRGCTWLDAEALTTLEKKVLLKFFVDQTECDEAFSNNRKLDALYSKYQNRIQTIIDDECDQMFFDEMKERGSIPIRHKDNGEVYWRTR